MEIKKNWSDFVLFLIILFLNVACQQEEYTPGIKNSRNNDKQSIELQGEEEITGGIVSGIYQNTFIAVHNGKVSGVYNADKKLNNCQFFFEGKFNPQSGIFDIQLRSLFDNEKIDGKLETIKGKVIIKTEVNFKSICPEGIFKDGITLSFSKKSNWKKITAVLNDKTEIFEEPYESMGTALKFKKNELLCILEEKNGWYRVESFGQTTNTGWIRKENTD